MCQMRKPPPALPKVRQTLSTYPSFSTPALMRAVVRQPLYHFPLIQIMADTPVEELELSRGRVTSHNQSDQREQLDA